MLGIFRRKSKKDDKQSKSKEEAPSLEPSTEITPDDTHSQDDTQKQATEQNHTVSTPQEEATIKKKKSLFKRLSSGLKKTRSQLYEGMASLVLGKKEIDDELLENLEAQLLMSDLGIEASEAIISDITKQLARKSLTDPAALIDALRCKLIEILNGHDIPLQIDAQTKPYVILFIGVNGAGKTTTIGKLAKQLQQQGKTVMLAAGDTFRTAAIEQLQVWGDRNNIPVVAQGIGSDSAAVIYDAYESATAKGVDVLIADTAGRLHTKSNLMEELIKIKRVLSRNDESVPHEIMLVLDAGIGQNGLIQAKEFHRAVGVTGITLTKLDGTAKGGVIFAIAKELNIPIRFIGIGEGIEDLRDFKAEDFVNAIFIGEENSDTL